jgi:DNA-binding NarL/FixJ family response regulator
MVTNRVKVCSKVAKLLIVDKHPVTREGLTARVGREPDLEVAGEAADFHEACQLVDDLAPDVVLIDNCLDNGDGLELVKLLKARNCPAKLLVWSVYNDPLYAERALRAGALGYVKKEEPTDVIVEAVRRVLGGGIYLSPCMMDLLVRRNVAGIDRDVTVESLDELSDRELTVFRMTGEGLDTYEIATRLRVSPKTVETYKARIKDKLGIDSGSEVLVRAVRWVVRNG